MTVLTQQPEMRALEVATMRAFVIKGIGETGVVEKPIPTPGLDEGPPPPRRSSAPPMSTPSGAPSQCLRAARWGTSRSA
jgi:hypothetical protein